ncbi:MAG: hypothetical protein AAGH79_08525 [Bacteroidota bacterium]
MMRPFTLLISTLLVLLALGCQNENAENTETTPSEPAAAEEPKMVPAGEFLPSVPIEKLEYLWNNCDYVDYVFYELPISMSLDVKNSIQYALSHIAENPASLRPDCKPIGRIFFQVQGENYLEADFYFSNGGCTYYVFLEDGKPKYGNYMTEEGAKYMNNNLSQAGAIKQQIQ